ncbi:MAG: hypothetical protein LBN08_05615 [Lactobacillales bacterium]|nr:hypothetical protein [Lactobacillales bacterium]
MSRLRATEERLSRLQQNIAREYRTMGRCYNAIVKLNRMMDVEIASTRAFANLINHQQKLEKEVEKLTNALENYRHRWAEAIGEFNSLCEK